MVLDAGPVSGMTRVRPVRGGPLPGFGDRDAGRPLTGFGTKKAAFLFRYRAHPEYGNRSAAGRVATELAPLAGLQAGTGRTYIAEELRKLTNLAARPQLAEEDDVKPAG